MTEITDLDPVDSGNTAISGESLDGAIANMGRMDNTLQAFAGMLGRSIRSTYLRWIDGTDSTKRVALDLSGLPTATTRTWTAPYYSGTLGLVSDIRGQIYGLTLSNNVTDATNDIDIEAGSAVDSTGAVSMLLASGLTKRLDAAWAVGNNQGMLDVAPPPINTNYYIFLIRRPDTGVVDVIATTQYAAPALPTNYTQYRRIGAIVRSAGAIKAFTQFGDLFLFSVPVLDISATLSTGVKTVALTCPINVTALVRTAMQSSASTTRATVVIYSPYETDAAPDVTTGNSNLTARGTGTIGLDAAADLRIRLNGSSQLKWNSSITDAGGAIRLLTLGWIDTRGQQNGSTA